MSIPTRCLVRYDRAEGDLRLTLKGVTNHELRELLVGLWSRLDGEDRADHIAELIHYAPAMIDPAGFPDRYLSVIAKAIREGEEGTNAINLRNMPLPGDPEA